MFAGLAPLCRAITKVPRESLQAATRVSRAVGWINLA